MSKEIWIVIAAIIILLAPYGLAKLSGTDKELLGWADGFLPGSTATSEQGNSATTDYWNQDGAGTISPLSRMTRGV